MATKRDLDDYRRRLLAWSADAYRREAERFLAESRTANPIRAQELLAYRQAASEVADEMALRAGAA